MAQKPVGWKKEPARHALAAHGVKTKTVHSNISEHSRGATKYCGYVVGRNEGQITPEQVERLFHFLHANYTATDFIQMNDEQLHEIAEDSEEEWRY